MLLSCRLIVQITISSLRKENNTEGVQTLGQFMGDENKRNARKEYRINAVEGSGYEESPPLHMETSEKAS